MNILFVLPYPKATGGMLNLLSSYPSLTLNQLKALTPKEHNIDTIDERYQRINFNKDYDIVGISTITYTTQRAYEIADTFKKMNKTVVLGGYHSTALPQEAKMHADSVVIGEAEGTWPQLLKDFKNGCLKPFYKSNEFVKPEKIPAAAHDLYKKLPFVETVQATRGCPNTCLFCAIRNIEGKILRKRPINEVIKEIQDIKKKNLFFADSSLTINLDYTKNLFKEMVGLNKKFICCGNVNVLSNDDEFLKLAREAGCNLIQVGFESTSQVTIDQIGKFSNKIDNYSNAIKKIRDHGMEVMGLFMFGFDTDTIKVFENTLNAIYKWDLKRIRFSILTPFPGTILYNEYEKSNRILTKEWSKYNCQTVVYQPKNMTKEELSKNVQKISDEFFSLNNSIRRNLSEKTFSLAGFISNTILDYSAKTFIKTLGGYK